MAVSVFTRTIAGGLTRVKRALAINIWIWVIPVITFVIGVAFWLILALSTPIRNIVSSSILSFPGVPINILPLSAMVLLAVAVGLYFYIDYKQHQRPFRQEGNASAYAPIHHAKVVFLPRLLFNWKQSVYWFSYSLASLVFVVTILVSRVSPAYAAGPYTGPHGNDVFAMLVKTDNPGGDSGNNQFRFDMVLAGPSNWTANMNFNVDCDNDGDWEFTNHNDYFTCTYPVAGTYTVVISGTITRAHYEDYWWNDAKKILEIQQWGNTPWEYMYFGGATNMQITANDTPNLSNGTNLSGAFWGNTSFNSNINNWDTSKVVSISGMFGRASSFNQPLNNWDTSSMEYMDSVFSGASSFNQPLDTWNTSNVTDMSGMFSGASSFNQNISSWDVSNVTNMNSMFGSGGYPYVFSGASSFNQPLDTWNTSNVTDMSGMFSGATNFSQGINNWNTSNVTNMSSMFSGATSFNQPLNSWNTSSVTDMSGMFAGATNFNQPLNNWNTGSVTIMNSMFEAASAFNGNISTWNTGSVTDMNRMFSSSTNFNQPLNNWNTSNVTNMRQMFGSWNHPSISGASTFNQPLNAWNTSNVTDMSEMFLAASTFNQPLNAWNTSNVTDMSSMFAYATAFNGNISTWNTNSLEYMNSGGYGLGMFEDATSFNQNINSWGVSGVTNMAKIFKNATSFNQPLSTWDISNVADMREMFAGAASFNHALNNWNTGNVTTMSGMFSGASSFNQPLNNWNTSNVTNMGGMFSSATNFNQPLNNWNTSNVTVMNSIFYNASSFNGSISSWDTSKVTTLYASPGMFQNATSFNQPIGAWNISGFTSLENMFSGATSFNQPLNNWNTSNVTNMGGMFSAATAFNGDINTWDVSSVANMSAIFQNATSFNQDVTNWDTSSLNAMTEAFKGAASFNQNIGNWNIENITYLSDALNGSGISPETYDAILSDWSEQNLQSNVIFYPYGLMYCESLNQRARIISDFQWNIYGDNYVCPPNVATGAVQSVSLQAGASVFIDIKTSGSIYDVGVEYGEDTTYGGTYSATSFNFGEQMVNVTGVRCGTTYHYRAYLTNDRGTAHGEDATFTTPACNDYSLSVRLINSPPVTAGTTAEYELSVKNGGPSDSIGPYYFYIAIPKETTYQSADFVNAHPASNCTDYGLASSLPYGSFSGYDNRLVVCVAMPMQAVVAGSDFAVKLKLAVTANYIPDITTLRGLIIGFADDSEVSTLSDALIGTDPIYDLNSNNVYNHIYKITKEEPSVPDKPIVEEKTKKPNTPTQPHSENNAQNFPVNFPKPIEYLAQLSKQAKQKDTPRSTYKMTGFLPMAVKNLPWAILLVGSVLYMTQAYKQFRQNTILRRELTITNQTREGIEGFLRIVTHYLVTPITIISLTLESVASKPALDDAGFLQYSTKKLKDYVNGLIANLNAQGSAIKSELISAGKITRYSVIRWVLIPSGAALILTVIALIGMTQVGLWSTSQSSIIFTTSMLTAAVGLSITFFQIWQNQRQLNADLTATNLVAQRALQSRTDFVMENQHTLMNKSHEVETAATRVRQQGISQSFMNGIAQLKKVATAFATLTKVAKTGATESMTVWSIETFLQPYQKQAEDKGVTFVYNGPRQVHTWIPNDEMSHIISTIISNAVQFTPEGGSIMITANSKGSSLQMTVEDTGVGIKEDKLLTLMQPFARGTETETYNFEGLGLNLYIARLIAEKHSGSIKLESSEAKGTKVTVQI